MTVILVDFVGRRAVQAAVLGIWTVVRWTWVGGPWWTRLMMAVMLWGGFGGSVRGSSCWLGLLDYPRPVAVPPGGAHNVTGFGTHIVSAVPSAPRDKRDSAANFGCAWVGVKWWTGPVAAHPDGRGSCGCGVLGAGAWFGLLSQAHGLPKAALLVHAGGALGFLEPAERSLLQSQSGCAFGHAEEFLPGGG